MSRRKFNRRFISKYEEDAVIITAKIVGIEQQNEIIGERYKNIFYLKSKDYPQTGKMCVYWGRTTFNTGDEIEAKGRINQDGVFLVWSYMIMRRSAEGQGSTHCPSTPAAVKRA